VEDFAISPYRYDCHNQGKYNNKYEKAAGKQKRSFFSSWKWLVLKHRDLSPLNKEQYLSLFHKRLVLKDKVSVVHLQVIFPDFYRGKLEINDFFRKKGKWPI
jgi:hypothetical protein